MMIWLLVGSFAGASEPHALQACCDATNATLCPDNLAAVGPGSKQVVGPAGNVVSGVWTLDCDGGPMFEVNASVTVAGLVPSGTVVSPIVPAAVACFDATCRLPQDLCLRYDGKRVKSVVCGDGSDAPDALWRADLRVPRGAVIIGGRLLGTEAPEIETTPRPVRVPVPAPVVARAIDATLPPPPPVPCIPAGSLRQPSNDQVDQGNEAIVAGNVAGALDRYRAALTINKCNAFAWAALGDAFLQSQRPSQAVAALEHATALMPTNFHAWTNLGRAREQAGNSPAAAQAYQRALDARPGHTPAAEGLSRVQ